MKTSSILARLFLTGFFTLLFFSTGLSQDNPSHQQDTIQQKVIVFKNDGSTFTGVIISKDEREILIETENLGRVYIPMHEIKEIRPFKKSGQGTTLFSTRYFLTTNGLSMEKGEQYIILNYYGPEYHVAVAKDFSVGIMTTWFAMPIIGSAKYSIRISDNVHLAVGVLAGTLSWADMGSNGALFYGAITLGNYVNNFTFSAGYATVSSHGDGGSATLLSPACLLRLGNNVHFVMDSFIYLGKKDDSFAILVPGLRFARPMKRSSIQFGFAGIITGGETLPAPFPVLSWFYEL
jgi:hypothetical protein